MVIVYCGLGFPSPRVRQHSTRARATTPSITTRTRSGCTSRCRTVTRPRPPPPVARPPHRTWAGDRRPPARQSPPPTPPISTRTWPVRATAPRPVWPAAVGDRREATVRSPRISRPADRDNSFRRQWLRRHRRNRTASIPTRATAGAAVIKRRLAAGINRERVGFDSRIQDR